MKTSEAVRQRLREVLSPLSRLDLAGQITDEQLVDELTRWDYAPGDYRTDGFTADLAQTPGSFDDVLDAMYDKLIPRDLYAVVAKALTEEDLPQRQW